MAGTAGDLAQARALVSTNRHALSVLVGRTPGDLPETWLPQIVAVPMTPTVGLPAAVLARRPDIKVPGLASLPLINGLKLRTQIVIHG